MKERIGRVGAKEPGRKLPKFAVRASFALVMIALFAICISAMAQENTADYWYEMSQELFNNVSLEESAQALDKALQIDPENASLWQTKGSILTLMGKKDEANNAFQKAYQILNQSIEKNPKDVATLLSKSQALQSMDKTDEALKTIDEAIALNPENIEFRLGKAEILTLAGRYNESIEAYDNAVELVSTNDIKMLREVIFSRANSFYDAGSYKDAIKDYDKAIKISPEFAPAWNNKGLALLKLGESEEALKMFYKTAEIDPTHFDESTKGLALKALGRYNESLESFDKALEHYPSNPLIWVDKGDVLQALGRNEEAKEAFAKAKELGYNG